MEKRHKTIPAVGEFQLPEEIVQHIQSFMSQKEAARTTLVSKSWYGAWSTRPDLIFDQYDLRNRLPKFATKTLQRYEDLNLNIHTFCLRMTGRDSLARELILKAIKLGAIDLTIQVLPPGFVLPDEVLETQTLARLSVRRPVTVDLERRNKPLISSNLKSLALSNTGDFSCLSRRFPLLEDLTVELVDLNTKDSLSKSELWVQFPCLKTLVIRGCYFRGNGEDVIRIRSPSLECLTIGLQKFTKAKLEFDVPNIRKFKFEGDDVPRLELKTSSSEWESDIRITCSPFRGTELCFRLRLLKKFVKLLSPSRVSLAQHVIQPRLVDQNRYVGDGLAIPAVENLTISGSRLSPAFLNALLWSCRPNFVNIQRRCVRGIEKENVEQFQHLSSLPWNTFLDDSISGDDWEEEFVRFQLK